MNHGIMLTRRYELGIVLSRRYELGIVLPGITK